MMHDYQQTWQQKDKNTVKAFILILFILCTISCKNDLCSLNSINSKKSYTSNNSSNSTNTFESSKPGQGKCSECVIEIIFSENITNLKNQDNSRSAYPDKTNLPVNFSNIEWIFYVYKIQNNERQNQETFDFYKSNQLINLENKFVLPLEKGEWRIKLIGFVNNKEFLEGEISQLIIAENGFYQKTINVFLIEKNGFGYVDLWIDAKNGPISKISISNTATVLDKEYFLDENQQIHINYNGKDLPSGNYEALLTFFIQDEAIFSLPEIFLIRNNCCTNKWSNPIFYNKLDNQSINMLRGAIFYVKGSQGVLENYSDDNNSGTFSSPLASIQKAIKLIKMINDEKSVYTIYVDGEITPSEKSDNEIFSKNTDSTFISIDSETPLFLEIIGITKNARINAARTNECSNKGRVITISNNVHLSLKNIIICGGYSNGKGGGIYLNGTSFTSKTLDPNKWNTQNREELTYNLKIMDNTVICGNHSNNRGGGIFIQKGAVLISGKDTYIKDNSSVLSGGGISTDNSSKKNIYLIIKDSHITNNQSQNNGGGFHVVYSLLDLENTYIENNKASAGGGLTTGTNNNIYLKNCIINNNFAINEEGNGGGGIFASGGGSQINLLNGTKIKENHSESKKQKGGGIRKTSSKIYISDNVIITDNFAGDEINNLTINGKSNSIDKDDSSVLIINEPLLTTRIGINCLESSLDESSSSESQLPLIEDSACIFTKGFSITNPDSSPADFFISDSSNYSIKKSTTLEGEICKNTN